MHTHGADAQHLIFQTRTLTGPGSHLFHWSGWLETHNDHPHPISVSLLPPRHHHWDYKCIPPQGSELRPSHLQTK